MGWDLIFHGGFKMIMDYRDYEFKISKLIKNFLSDILNLKNESLFLGV